MPDTTRRPEPRQGARRTLDPAAATALRQARRARGWTIAEVGRRSGVSRRMIGMLEAGQRAPSVLTAGLLIAFYEMTPAQAQPVRDAALADVGKDSPYRLGKPGRPEGRRGY